MLKFITPNGVPVKFTRVDLTPELRKISRSAVGMKNFRPKLKLAESYELAADYISSFWHKYLK